MTIIGIIICLVIGGLGLDLIIASGILGAKNAIQNKMDIKDDLDAARIELMELKKETEKLRAARLERDLMVVENRAHLVASQTVKADLAIEVTRRELGYPADRGPKSGDQGAWLN